MNILLAEDNLVNQRVTTGILEKREHFVIAVNNGKEVLQALACQRFDLVLMDVQMPEMDGFEATRAIRLNEQETGQHIPIIALTAHAMKGDRERCLDAGMDDYLTKPVEPKVLHEMLARWSSPQQIGTTQVTGPDPGEKPPEKVENCQQTEVFNLETLRSRVEGDLDLLMELVELYLASCPKQLDEIDAAIAARDGQQIARAAHTLKGMLKNMCADRCADAALELERCGKAGDLAQVGRSRAALENELEKLRVILEDFAKGVTT